MSGFILTDDNYYTPEANQHYFSCSQFEEFMSCEAAALAHVQGRYAPPETDAFFLGKYFHSYFEGKEAFKAFCNEPENFGKIFKTKTTKSRGTEITGKYATIVQIDNMIKAAETEPAIKRLIDMEGMNEISMHGKLFGKYPWRIRIDKLIPDMDLIIDWKTVANIRELKYDSAKGKRVSFVETYNYMFRAAVYSEIYKEFRKTDTLPLFWLVCLSKQEPPDKEIINLTHAQRYELELEKVSEKITRFQAIKDGIVPPKRCGHCAYCRSTKTVTSAMDYWELEPDYGAQKETEEAYGFDSET